MTDDETKQLLREIRDLQKAHFDRYVQFTEQVLESERQAAAKRDRENDAYFQKSAAYRQEMQDVIKRNQRFMLLTPLLLFGILVGGAVLYVLGSMILSALPMP